VLLGAGPRKKNLYVVEVRGMMMMIMMMIMIMAMMTMIMMMMMMMMMRVMIMMLLWATHAVGSEWAGAAGAGPRKKNLYVVEV
jgi:hypothetical protein